MSNHLVGATPTHIGYMYLYTCFASLQVVDRLSSDENGELLLQPIGYCKELVDGLAAMAVAQDLSLERRTDSARVLLGITQKAAQDSIVFVNARTVRDMDHDPSCMCHILFSDKIRTPS